MDDKGFTLVEILLAITLFGIALGSLIFIMETGFDGVFDSSHKNTAIYKAQDMIEGEIANNEDFEDDTVINIEIKFSNPNLSFNATGNIVIGEHEEKGVSSKMVTFIPDSVKDDIGEGE